MSTKITDLVDQSAIDQVKSLNEEIKKLLDTYTNTAREISKGLEINVKVVGDIDKLQNLLIEKTKEAVAVNEQLASAVARRGQVIANTTPTLSRELMEMERLNKSQREAYTDGTKVKARAFSADRGCTKLFSRRNLPSYCRCACQALQ